MLEIYFSDLNENGRKKVMEYFNINSLKEANFDMDIIPLAIIEATADNEEDS